MFPSRSALVLLSCMTCVGFAPGAVGSSSDSHRTDLLNPLIWKTVSTHLMTDLPSVALLAQVSAPKPTKDKDPNLNKLIQDLQLPKKPTTKAQVSQSNQPLWWIAIGAVLVVVAGGLLYVLRSSDRQNETETLESLPDSESQEIVNVENGAADVQKKEADDQINFTDSDQNGHNTTILAAVENNQSEQSTPQPQEKSNGNRKKKIFSLSKKQNAQQAISQIKTSTHQDNSNISPLAEEIKSSEELTPPAKSEALEVRETTRLSKINIVDELIKDLQNPDPNKRHKAIWELAQRGDSRAMQPLVDILIDADSKQRGLILEALSQIGSRTLKPMNRALVISLQDENPEVRKNAIRDVTRIYDMMAQISQLLRYAVDDPDVEVQETARWALTQLNRIRGLSAIDNFPNRPNSNHPDN